MSEKTFNILLIVDNPGDARLIQEMLSGITGFQYNLEWVDSIAKGLKHLSEAHSDVVLLDLSVPDRDWHATLTHLRDRMPTLPIVVLTGARDESLGVQAVQMDAQDYLLKDKMDSHLLVRVIRHAIEQKRMGEELKKSRASFYSIVERSVDGVIVVDREGMVRFTNPALAAMFGRTREGLNGELFGFPVMSGESTEIDIIRRGGKAGVGEMYVVETEWEGERAYLITIRDISEHKQMEQELEAKNREMERFTYTVSHDLRSPLDTIRGFVDLVQEDLKQNALEEAANDLQDIDKAATKMEKLLSDTLQLSRIGRIANPPEDVPFGEIVKDALEQTAEQIKSSGVEISVAEDFPVVHVDQMRIAEVLVNLIGNSIKYAGEQPTPKVEIRYRVDREETVFFVKDNGIGIDKSEHEKVFELFYQVDQSGGGSGAGLAIVKRIIEVHNGRMWVESEKGKGCTVCFILPTTTRGK
ncbi:MAG: response regulator [Methanosarcinales archaeon]|nr:response regulator [Methanosarcinales archaeon]